MNNNRITVIVGAGATIEIGGKTTQNITEQVIEKRGDCFAPASCLLCRIYETLKSNNSGNTNFETIFHILEILMSYNWGWNPETKNPRMFPPFSCFVKLKLLFEDLNYEVLIKSLGNVIKIISESVSEYNNSFLNNINNLWYKNFWKNNFDIFTLNYDTTIEQSLHDYLDGYEIDPSADHSSPQKFNPRLFENITTESLSTVCHLHGCILYGHESGNMLLNGGSREYSWEDIYKYKTYEYAKQTWFGRSTNNTQSGESAIIGPIITGLRKSDKLQELPYSAYSAFLWERILKNPNLLIVGYSFGDLHINHLINQMKIIHGNESRIVLIDYFPLEDNDIFSRELLFMSPDSPINPEMCLFLSGLLNSFDSEGNRVGTHWWEKSSAESAFENGSPIFSPDKIGMVFVKGFKNAVDNYYREIFNFFK